MKITSEIPAITASLLLAIISYFLIQRGADRDLSIIVSGIILLITFVFIRWIYRPIRRNLILLLTKAEIGENGQDQKYISFRSRLTETLGVSSRAEIAKYSGVQGSWASFRDCESKIIKKIESASEVRLLTNNGKSDLAKGTRIYDALTNNRTIKIRVLLASPNSYFVSTKWATDHNIHDSQSLIWIKRIQDSIDEIQYIRDKYRVDIDYRFYYFPFVWHMWIIDKTAFISAWLEKTRNISNTRVIEVQKDDSEREKHLYDMFFSFFERNWNEFSEAPKDEQI